MSQQAEDKRADDAASSRERRIAKALVQQVIEEIVDADYYNPLVPGLAERPAERAKAVEAH